VGYLRVDTGSERGGSGERSVELLEVFNVETSIGLGDFGTEDLVEELSDTSLATRQDKSRVSRRSEGNLVKRTRELTCSRRFRTWQWHGAWP
jgi:hypothetical protein